MIAGGDDPGSIGAGRIARDAERERLYALELRRVELERAQRQPGADGQALGATIARTRRAIVEQRGAVDKAETRVRDGIAGLVARRTPQQLIETWEDDIPIVLLPLRIETRWKTELAAGAQLWVRVFPDDIEVTTHEKVLTGAEVEHGRAYHVARRAAGDDAEARALAWHALVDRFGANRAAWVALQTKPINEDAASADPQIELEFTDPELTKPDSWTTAPHTRVLPDRFVLLGWRGDELVLEEVGELVDDVVVLGPSPLEDRDGGPSISRDALTNKLRLGESFAWVRDFDAAVRRGLGFRIDVDDDAVASGFDRLLVLGVKHSASADEARHLVEDLLDNHHYSLSGLAVVPQGTPTNNTEGNDSGYARAGRDAGQSVMTEAGPPLFVPVADRSTATDGQRVADYLGIDYEPLVHVEGADLTDNAEAVAMNRALYAGTLGYYLDHMLNEVVGDGGLAAVRQHFSTHVTGRGPVAAIRVGSQPYGILPTSAFKRWRTSPARGQGAIATVARRDPFQATLYAVLARLDEAWSSIDPGPAQIGAPGNGAAHLLDVLGLQPTSAELYQRVGYSWDYLRNLEEFAFFGGAHFGDVLAMAIEGQAARGLLAGLGYAGEHDDGTPKPLPLLLTLIWRHYHVKLDATQLIDGQPLSEATPIKALDPSLPDNYIDWLRANAADADKLERQDFGRASAPGTLLYMMLRFSLLMEAAHGIHLWLGRREVEADELVRSRKFMNIGPQPSPSAWEVFRAPANRIVAQEATAEPLLKLIHFPQFAADEGRNVREQLDALLVLRGLPTARLERALVEHVDTLSYRLDAWQTSLFARRLHDLRRLDEPADKRRTGLFLGAYGLLEHVRPASGHRKKISERELPEPLRTGADNLFVENASGGYVHAPSLNHATAAALLRNGYLTHATPEAPDALAVNLSSDRVRRARYLLDGIRNGQSLEVLLGVQFERGLHDWTTRPDQPVILDQLKPEFRAAFPIRRTRVPQTAGADAGASIVMEDHTVVNGLDLARSTLAYPYGVAGLTALSAQQRAAIIGEKDAIANTLDSLRDVLTAEGAYQLALGNFERATAVLQSAGSATAPPEVEVLRTPRSTGISFTNRLAVQLSPSVTANPWPAIAMTDRALLEPSLNNWIGTLLGDPATIRCRVSAVDAGGGVLTISGVLAERTMTLAELRVQPLDFVHIVRRQAEESGVADLEARVRYAFARVRDVPDDAVVRIAFADAGADPNARPFAEALALGDRIRRLLGASRPLAASHFQSASKDAPPPPGNPGRIDLPELRARVGTRLAAVRGRFGALQTAVDDARTSPGLATAEALRAALVDIAVAGFAFALPQSAVGAADAQLDTLVRQGDSVLAQAAEVGPKTDAALASVDAAEGSAERKAGELTDVARAWMADDFVLLPRFVFADAAAVAQADAARDSLLTYARDTAGMALPVDEWLHGVACVRPLVHNFEIVRAMADATLDEPLRCAPLQMPHAAGDSWLGVQYPPDVAVLHDTVAIVQHLPQGFAAAGPQCGLLVDEWVETVPAREEVTGLTFNFDAPDSAPPQALLLAVTPEITGRWSWDDLVETVLDTFRRVRLRAVEPDAIGSLTGIGTLLPAVMAEFSTGTSTVSLDYALMVPEISAAVLATPQTAGG